MSCNKVWLTFKAKLSLYWYKNIDENAQFKLYFKFELKVILISNDKWNN